MKTMANFLADFDRGYRERKKMQGRVVPELVLSTFSYQNKAVGSYWEAVEDGNQEMLESARKQLLDSSNGYNCSIILETFLEADDFEGLRSFGKRYEQIQPALALKAYVYASDVRGMLRVVKPLGERRYWRSAQYALRKAGVEADPHLDELAYKFSIDHPIEKLIGRLVEAFNLEIEIDRIERRKKEVARVYDLSLENVDSFFGSLN